VAQDFSFFHVGAALVHVQVGATDVGGGDFDYYVGGFFDLGVGDFFDRDVFGSVVNQSFHFLASTGSDSIRNDNFHLGERRGVNKSGLEGRWSSGSG
jgi:hypothetical protein